MKISKKIQEYRDQVEKKYNLYNSLFMSLPYEKLKNIGMLIPLLQQACEEGFPAGKSVLEIVDTFFKDHTEITEEEEKIDFFFRVIQYIERQVVLFDSIEDAAFAHSSKIKDYVSIEDFTKDLQFGSRIRNKLSTFRTRLVLTAHPTQFYPLSVLEIMKKMRNEIEENDIQAIDLLLQQLGMTSFINPTRPTPLEEAKNIIYYLRHVYYDAIGDLYSRIKYLINDSAFSNPELISIGFWPGGDRDGNPFVTGQTTMSVADELRVNLMKCYYNDIKDLQYKLTFRKVERPIENLKDELYESMFNPDKILSYQEILAPLKEILEIIQKDYNGLYASELEDLIDKVHIFKTHFATLDIRQDNRVHQGVLETISQKYRPVNGSFEVLSEAERIALLTETVLEVSPEDFDDPIVKDTILNIRQLGKIQAKNGEKGCNRYIISNAEDIFSVLSVFGLFRWCGYNDESMAFDIIPLFETLLGMQQAENTMIRLFENRAYRDHVTRRGNCQTIMLGYSDGTKDGGFLKANWAIYQAKETLTAVCNNFGINAIFFDGRGGPPARGGGKTHRFYASLGGNIANHEIQLTIQGQTITSTYGTKEQIAYNCEQLITAGLESEWMKNENGDIPPSYRKTLDELAQLSFEKYHALKNHEKFIPYLEYMSTLKYYSNANIGSRPAKRKASNQLKLEDLRAISYVGSWSQLKQNVPGYYGIGTAIKVLKDQDRMGEVQELFQHVPYFKALVLNSMMSLSKTYFPLTNYMKSMPEYADFWGILYEEYLLSKEMLLEISGYRELMEEEPISRISIQIREKIVLPLLAIQQYGLQKISKGSNLKDAYEKIVTRSLYGNINASRNSA